MTSRQRFQAACAGRPLERPPIWIMRQAGRYLPEYRALKEKHSFVEMVRTPELAAEVTLQPLRRFPLDAAILFSDILVVPEAMGQGYRFREEGGIGMEFAVQSRADIDRLDTSAVAERLGYMGQTLRRLRQELKEEQALLGFCGSPWTLATYMVEGGSSDDFSRLKTLFYADRELFEMLLEKITAGVIAALRLQIEAGADAVQIFDSWGGAVAGSDYEAASLRWIRQIVKSVQGRVPIILFGKGTAASLSAQAACGVNVLSFDWSVNLADIRTGLPAQLAVQGNLDPVILNTSPQVVQREAERLLQSMAPHRGHIFNLGHGILPQAKVENVAALVETVTGWDNRSSTAG